MEDGQKITARVKVHYKNGENPVSVSFLPDYADGRNREWANATPSLSLSMVLKPEVAAMFEMGEAIELTFTRSPDQPELEG